MVDYRSVLEEARSRSVEVDAFLLEQLPYLWRDAYMRMTPRIVNIFRFQYDTFEYLYDDYASLEATATTSSGNRADCVSCYFTMVRSPEFVPIGGTAIPLVV
jgi:hypothetical protein